MGFTPHKAKQPLLGMDLKGEGKKEEHRRVKVKEARCMIILLFKRCSCRSKENNMKVQNFTI